jgi:transmembrane sensor
MCTEEPSIGPRIGQRAKLEIDVPWDDLRAARVHKKALEAFRAGEDGVEPAVVPMARFPWRRAAGVVLVALAMAAAAVVWLRARSDTPELTWTATSTLAYADGSVSRLSATAQLHVIEDEVERVEVAQRAGRVRYEIKPRPERRFVVGALGVTITVLGTVFDVNVEQNRVEVVVERGRVRVDHGDRHLELGAGEHVTVVGDSLDTKTAWDTEGKKDGQEKSAANDTNPSTGDTSTGVIDEESMDNASAPEVPPAASVAVSAADYMRRADAARAAGRLDEAVSALSSLLRDHPRDARATLALFTIGRVERQRGRHADAARAFEQCGNALGGDAVAEAAASWQQAGQGAQARAAAERYLQLFPSGVHAPRMRAMTGG